MDGLILAAGLSELKPTTVYLNGRIEVFLVINQPLERQPQGGGHKLSVRQLEVATWELLRSTTMGTRIIEFQARS